jgi:hypothetical protein
MKTNNPVIVAMIAKAASNQGSPRTSPGGYEMSLN